MLSIQKTESQKEKDRLENPPEKMEELQEELELEEILHALETCKGNRVKTAEMLEISRATLFRKMKKHNLL